uniref:Centrosomal protein 350 n=1 Tax=Homo sapiens TaxID=9606 RepID=A0A994J5V0_HUMAN
MRSSKSKEVPLPNPRNSQSKDTVQADITTSWDALSQTKAAGNPWCTFQFQFQPSGIKARILCRC